MSEEYNEYDIETVEDFLKVPVERLDDCLEEFKTFLDMRRQVIDMCKLFETEELSVKDMIEFGAFTWVDDGKTDITINVTASVSKEK